MSRKLSVAFFVPSLRSDWNNGNAHFLRGLVRALGREGEQHDVLALEPESSWTADNLIAEGDAGARSFAQYASTYPEISLQTYTLHRAALRSHLAGRDIVIVHEWNRPELIDLVLSLRGELQFRTIFHDTHHRASSSPQQIKLLQLHRFDGVLAFGEALRQIYLKGFGLTKVWVFHEAADTSVFYPRSRSPQDDLVWIGNWGDGERSAELCTFLIRPAARLAPRTCAVYGVRYPQTGLDALAIAGIRYRGYLPNLDAPEAYARSRVTVHVPRQQYTQAMMGIPTIRVFEALACSIPLVSAPWLDTENLFNEGDFLYAETEDAMTATLQHLLSDSAAAKAQAERGRQTILSRHTCKHRAAQLTEICQEVLAA